jgi:CheY-like chemotaxis protein
MALTRTPRHCWNCDLLSRHPVKVPFGRPPSELNLCQFCYRSSFVPLLAGGTPARRARELQPTVLVVDDDPSVRRLLTFALRTEGFAVQNAENGLEALSKIHEQWPQAIVLDLWMPIMNGPRFLEVLRQTSPGHAIPVVVVSANGTSQTAADLGVEALVPKPFDLRTLIGKVAELVAASA